MIKVAEYKKLFQNVKEIYDIDVYRNFSTFSSLASWVSTDIPKLDETIQKINRYHTENEPAFLVRFFDTADTYFKYLLYDTEDKFDFFALNKKDGSYIYFENVRVNKKEEE